MAPAPTVTFIPCCNRGEGIIFIDTLPFLSTNLVDGTTYRYLGGPATGYGLGPLGIDELVFGQCYTLIFGVSPSVYPILPTSILNTTFAPTGNNCLDPACPECSPEQPFTNRYLEFIPCCDEDDPILFRPPPSDIPTSGIAIYAGGVSGSPYVSTDKFGNLSTPLFSNLCYSITSKLTGPSSIITNAAEYNNLQIAPAEIAGNYSYLSIVSTDCFLSYPGCPSCNTLCFTLWSCNGITNSQPLFTTSTDLTAFVGTNIVVSSLDPNDNIVEICVFVQNTTEFNCPNAIEVVVDSESCECDCTCYIIIGEIKSVDWIDCFGVYHLVATPLSPFEICAGAYPLALPLNNKPLQVINNGLCAEVTVFNDKRCEEIEEYICNPICYVLQDCLGIADDIFSYSTSLQGPANLSQTVTIAGFSECWEVLIADPEDCDCPVNVNVLQVHECCEACLPNINYKLTNCDDNNLFIYTSSDLSLYVNKVVLREDCPGCWIVSEIDGDIPTDTPIVVLEDYINCELCKRKYYRLKDCLGIRLDIITYTDLSQYIPLSHIKSNHHNITYNTMSSHLEQNFTYDCIDGNCVSVSGSGGEFSTLLDCVQSLSLLENYNCADKTYSGITGDQYDQYTWMALNNPNSLFNSFYFESSFVCDKPDQCIGANGGCLIFLERINIYDSSSGFPVLIFSAYSANELIDHLNTTYPLCFPSFTLNQSYDEVNNQLQNCQEDLFLTNEPIACECDYECQELINTYDCIEVVGISSCVGIEGPGGEYATYEECLENCGSSYDCIDCDCVLVEGSGGEYATLEDCELNCHSNTIITLEWCPETCWEVCETIEDDGAGVISDVLNSYTECIDCLTSAPCVCSTIKNYNDIVLEYKYLDCEGILQSIVLKPGQKSDRLCLIRWYVPEPCDELIVTITYSTGIVSNITVYQSSSNHPGPVYLNGKPTFYDAFYNIYIYYTGKNWILSRTQDAINYIPIATLKCGLDCDCPIGSWINISSLPNQDIYSSVDYKYTIEYFGNCINGVCPPVKNKQKSVTPGYNTPGCEAWKYEEISCRAAEAMYKQVLELRYGISNCCPEEDEQYIVQKELIDLAALYDPAYPCATNSCGCNNDCNCSTAEPVCPPIPLTYNCFCTQSACECIEIGNGSGEYSTLALCQAACVPLPITSYNCTDGACVLVSGPGGQYPTLAACEENCTPLPIISYNCVPLHSGSYCLDPGDGTGLYNTLIECENDCLTTYNCVNGNCVPISGPNGEYPTLVDCENSFIIVNQCIDQGIIDSDNFGTLENQFNWMSINHPSSLTYSYYFEAPIQCGPSNCVGPNGGCLQRLSSIEIVDTINIVVLFTAYQIDDLINYLNTNYPTCTPVFFDGQSFNTIASQFKICNPSLSIQLGGTPCVCSLGCADIE